MYIMYTVNTVHTTPITNEMELFYEWNYSQTNGNNPVRVYHISFSNINHDKVHMRFKTNVKWKSTFEIIKNLLIYNNNNNNNTISIFNSKWQWWIQLKRTFTKRLYRMQNSLWTVQCIVFNVEKITAFLIIILFEIALHSAFETI